MDVFALANKILSNSDNIVKKSIDVTIAHSYKGDMEGLIVKHLGITPSHVNVIIALNDFNTSSDYNGETEIILVPSDILNLYLGNS